MNDPDPASAAELVVERNGASPGATLTFIGNATTLVQLEASRS